MMNLQDDSLAWTFPLEGRNGPMGVSADGTLVAVSARLDEYDTIFILDATTGKQLATIPEVNRLTWGSNGTRMAFSPDGQRFAACMMDATVLVWSLTDLGIAVSE